MTARTALVTGGAGGLGEASAARLRAVLTMIGQIFSHIAADGTLAPDP